VGAARCAEDGIELACVFMHPSSAKFRAKTRWDIDQKPPRNCPKSRASAASASERRPTETEANQSRICRKTTVPALSGRWDTGCNSVFTALRESFIGNLFAMGNSLSIEGGLLHARVN
jgi:hypothetical protein